MMDAGQREGAISNYVENETDSGKPWPCYPLGFVLRTIIIAKIGLYLVKDNSINGSDPFTATIYLVSVYVFSSCVVLSIAGTLL